MLTADAYAETSSLKKDIYNTQFHSKNEHALYSTCSEEILLFIYVDHEDDNERVKYGFHIL